MTTLASKVAKHYNVEETNSGARWTVDGQDFALIFGTLYLVFDDGSLGAGYIKPKMLKAVQKFVNARI